MNKCVLIGNLVADPEARTTQSGIAQSKFKIAVQRNFKNANGEYEADFLPVIAWRQTAEFCNKYLAKGRKVAVAGSIQTRSYDAQDGSKRYVTEIMAEIVETVGRPEENAGKPDDKKQDEFTEVEDDDLPFD